MFRLKGALFSNRNVVLIYALSFLTGLEFAAPFYGVYLHKSLDQSTSAVARVLTTRFVSQIALEIPSGLAADFLGHRFTLVVATLCRMFSTICLLLEPNFYHFLFGAVLTGAANAMVSGTVDAVLFDSVTRDGRTNDFKQIIALSTLMWPVGATIASLIGGPIVLRHGMNAVLSLSLLPLFLALAIATLISDVETPSSVSRCDGKCTTAMRALASKIVDDVAKSPRLVSIVIYALSVYALSETPHQFRGIFFAELGIHLSDLGLLSAAQLALSSVGSLLSSVVSRRFGDYRTLQICTCALSVSLLSAVFTSNVPVDAIGGIPLSATIFLSGSFAWGVQWPIVSLVVNRNVSPHIRSTVVSIVHMLKRTGLAIAMSLFSFVADRKDVGVAMKLFALGMPLALVPLSAYGASRASRIRLRKGE